MFPFVCRIISYLFRYLDVCSNSFLHLFLCHICNFSFRIIVLKDTCFKNTQIALTLMENKNIDLSALRISRNQEQRMALLIKTGTYIGFAVSILILELPDFFLYQSLFTALQLKWHWRQSPGHLHHNQMLCSPQADTSLHNEKLQLLQREPEGLYISELWKETSVRKNQYTARLARLPNVRASLEHAKANLRLNESGFERCPAISRTSEIIVGQRPCESIWIWWRTAMPACSAFLRYWSSKSNADFCTQGIVGEYPYSRSHSTGTVLAKNADIGEMVVPMAASVGSKSAVVTIADMTSLQVEADVSESNIEHINPDQPCEITLDAYPEVRYQGMWQNCSRQLTAPKQRSW